MNLKLKPAAGMGYESGDILPDQAELSEIGIGHHCQLRLCGGAFNWVRVNGILPGGRYDGVFIDQPEKGLRVVFGPEHILQFV